MEENKTASKTIETFKEKIILTTTDGKEYYYVFNKSIPKYWQELRDLVAKDRNDFYQAKLISAKDAEQGACYLLTKDAENAREYINLFYQIAVDDDTVDDDKCAMKIFELVDLDALRKIAVTIIEAYSNYYHKKIQEGFSR